MIPSQSYGASLLTQSKQLDELNVCWNNVIRKIFNHNKRESVKSVLFYINRLNITHLITMRKINFYHRLRMSVNCILHNVLMSSYCCDNMCCSVFINKSFSTKIVTDHFECYANS